MSTTPPEAGEEPQREVRHGAPPGHFGNVPFVPTEEQRKKVRALAKTCKHEQPMAREWIASQLGISTRTLDRHFKDDLIAGRGEVVASLGAWLIGVAMGTVNGEAVTKERMDAVKFALARMGGWSAKVEMSGPDGRPMEVVDLSGMTPAALREYGRQAAIQQGLDPDETVGPPLDDDA